MEMTSLTRLKELAQLQFNLTQVWFFIIDDILYVPGLKKNLLSVDGLEDKGYRVLFMDKKVLLWATNEKLVSFSTLS